MGSCYTGVGSRQTPPVILILMEDIAELLALRGWILRSGGANGADTAFEKGVDKSLTGKKEIFLPWKGFNGRQSVLYDPPNEAYGMAAGLNPAWDMLSIGAKKLHARNCQQVLGEHLTNPSNLIIYYRPIGLRSSGTDTAIKLARQNNIPELDLASMVFRSPGNADEKFRSFKEVLEFVGNEI